MHISGLTRNGHIVHIATMSTLADWMRRNGVRDNEVAKAINRDRSIVSRIRRGELVPTLSVAVAIERLTKGAVAVQSWVKDDAA
jgi:ribosome-binding protein aMBF1 (putative translation factor)